MKYMHFTASCAYTALAELMEGLGVDTEDHKIALEMGLPWLFAKEDGAYISGPMLQGSKWFDLWLNPRGFRMKETLCSHDQLCLFLRDHHPAMLGLNAAFGKHAMVCEKYDGQYRFFNPTRQGSEETTIIVLGEEELLAATEEAIVVGEVIPTPSRQPDMGALLKKSISVLRENYEAITVFSSAPHAPDKYTQMLNRLFRPLFLDGIAMLTLAGEDGLASDFAQLQRDLMDFLRGPRSGILADGISLSQLRESTEAYARLIEKQLNQP